MYKIAENLYLKLSISVVSRSNNVAHLGALIVDENNGALANKSVIVTNGTCAGIDADGESTESEHAEGFNGLIAACPNGIAILDMEAYLAGLGVLPAVVD